MRGCFFGKESEPPRPQLGMVLGVPKPFLRLDNLESWQTRETSLLGVVASKEKLDGVDDPSRAAINSSLNAAAWSMEDGGWQSPAELGSSHQQKELC